MWVPLSLQGAPPNIHLVSAEHAGFNFEPLALHSPIQKMRTKLASVTEEPLLTMLTRNWKKG